VLALCRSDTGLKKPINHRKRQRAFRVLWDTRVDLCASYHACWIETPVTKYLWNFGHRSNTLASFQFVTRSGKRGSPAGKVR
jgi:hypothetical protein